MEKHGNVISYGFVGKYIDFVSEWYAVCIDWRAGWSDNEKSVHGICGTLYLLLCCFDIGRSISEESVDVKSQGMDDTTTDRGCGDNYIFNCADYSNGDRILFQN